MDPTWQSAGNISSFARKNTLWLLGLVPLSFVLVDVLAVSSGNIQTATYMLTRADVLSVMLNVLAQLLPPTVAIIYIAWFKKLRKGPPPAAHGRFPGTVFLSISFVTLLFLGNTLSIVTALFMVVIALFIVSSNFLVRRSREKIQLREGADGGGHLKPLGLKHYIVAFVVVQALLFVQGGTVQWAPTESVTVKGRAAVTAAVLSSDEVWTVFFTPSDSTVHIARSDDVQSRTPCQDTGAYWLSSFADRLSSKQLTECPKKQPRRL